MKMKNNGLEIVVSGEEPVVEAIVDTSSGTTFGGALGGESPNFILYNREAGIIEVSENEGIDVTYDVEAPTDSEIVYHVEISVRGLPACALDLSCFLEDGCLMVTFSKVREYEDILLVAIDMTRLITISSEDPDARMAITAHGGRLINPSKCDQGTTLHTYNWVKDSFATRGIIYSGPLTAVVGITSMDDALYSSVVWRGNNAYAGIGVRLRHRYSIYDPSYRSISLPLAHSDPLTDESLELCADTFVANETSTVTIQLDRTPPLSPEKGWISGARIIRSELRPKPSDYYKHRFINKIFVGDPKEPSQISFDDAGKVVSRIFHRTGGTKQVCYLVGWQHKGHDTGYPDVFTANSAAGGEEKLRLLINAGKSIGAAVSFHDNFDDAYQSSPAWDPNDISIDNRGELLKGGIWGGGQAYWNSMPVYARNKAVDRIERTLGQYAIEDTYHLDVLTASVFRLDFRREEPSSKDEDRDARLQIVHEYRDRGIDLSSEACGIPFIGEITYFWHLMRVPRSVYAGDRRIPLTPFIAHGHADYGGSHVDGNGILDGLLYGATVSDDIKSDTPMEDILDAYFLLHVPLDKLRDLEMTDYHESGTKKRIDFKAGSFVEVDFESGEHVVVVDDLPVLKNGVTFFADRDGYIVYISRLCSFFDATWPIPDELKGIEIVKAVPLLDHGEGEPVEFAVRDSLIQLPFSHGTAYRISTS